MNDALPPFEVTFEHKARRLCWTMRGFWAMHDVAAFANAMRKAVRDLGPPPQEYDGLCDSRAFPVQSTEVSNALGEIDRRGNTSQRGRTAIVVGSAMNKLQVQRTLKGPHLRIFLSMQDAEAWLHDKPTDAA